MIDINKTYRTRDGREVKLFTTEARSNYPVRGEVLDNCLRDVYDWIQYCWDSQGNGGQRSDWDLIECKPRIQREFWVSVYPDYAIALRDKEAANRVACSGRIACVKVTIDCEEGEGLE